MITDPRVDVVAEHMAEWRMDEMGLPPGPMTDQRRAEIKANATPYASRIVEAVRQRDRQEVVAVTRELLRAGL